MTQYVTCDNIVSTLAYNMPCSMQRGLRHLERMPIGVERANQAVSRMNARDRLRHRLSGMVNIRVRGHCTSKSK